jgi:hypothetical protein
MTDINVERTFRLESLKFRFAGFLESLSMLPIRG